MYSSVVQVTIFQVRGSHFEPCHGHLDFQSLTNLNLDTIKVRNLAWSWSISYSALTFEANNSANNFMCEWL